jgi:mono/diheme cytochrome c family protein
VYTLTFTQQQDPRRQRRAPEDPTMSEYRRHRGKKIFGGVVLLLVLLGAAGLAYSWHDDLPPANPPARGVFSAELVTRGSQLAALGNCMTCHTASPGSPYAGGVPLLTPFGTIHSTNITPDPVHGIGRWSEGAFRRAMREGVSRDGHLLYPAFPYDHFTRLSDDDIHALYALVMTRDPIAQAPRKNDLRFPFNLRPLVAGWNMLNLDKKPLQPAADHRAEWNRGAYLVDSLGHCSACHTPRNKLGAEDRLQFLNGGEADGWYAPALNSKSPSPLPWTVDAMTSYLRTGIAPDHAIAGGPMARVVDSFRGADEKDVRAMAVYIVSLMGLPSAERQAQAAGATQRAAWPMPMPMPTVVMTPAPAPSGRVPSNTAAPGSSTAAAPAPTPATTPAVPPLLTPAPVALPAPAADSTPVAPLKPAAPVIPATETNSQLLAGAAIYAGACARCHDMGRRDASDGALQMPLAVPVYDPDPRSLIRIVRDGVAPPPGEPGRFMPSFAGLLTNEQLVSLAAYLRRYAANAPAWTDLDSAVSKAKSP